MAVLGGGVRVSYERGNPVERLRMKGQQLHLRIQLVLDGISPVFGVQGSGCRV